MLWTSPKNGLRDFTIAVTLRLMNNAYLAVDAGGNDLSLQSWVDEKTLKNSTKIITELSFGNITSFKQVKDRAPVLAFHHELKIRRMIHNTINEGLRRRE